MPRSASLARRGGTVAMLVGLLGLLVFGFRPVACVAAPIPFGNVDVFYEFDEEPLPDFLEGFFAEQGLPLIVSPAAARHTGTLNGPRQGPARDVFRSIAASNNLLAYYDGGAVHIYKTEELVTDYITVPAANVGRVVALIREMGLVDDANRIDVSRTAGVIAVRGAPRFVDQVMRLADAAERQRLAAERRAAPPADTTLRYFRLRYAWAADTSIVVGRRQVLVPGVASLLNRVANPGSWQGGATERFLRPSAQRLRGQGLASFDPDGDQVTYEQQLSAAAGRLPPAVVEAAYYPTSDPGGPQITADAFHNSIIVRDVPERMALYENLISLLDVEPQLVEIEATIIDVDTQRLKDLGVSLRFRSTDSEIVFGPEGAKDDFVRAQQADDIDLLPALAGLSAGVIVGDSRRFAASLNALAENDTLNIVSRPQLITLNDMEAIVESNREIFVPVGGFREVDLFNVVAGTVLRVTPHIIEDFDTVKIRILTTIEDGDVQLLPSDVQSVEIPVVDRNAVTTQAIIREGQSLLLGGLRRDSQIENRTQVPVLSKVPLLGRLFRQAQTENSQTERLFLITPRLVSAERVAQMTRDLDERLQQQLEAMSP